MALFAYLIVLALLCLYGLHRYFLVATFVRVRQADAPPRPVPAEWPRVTVQLPMFNERYVARRVIEQACRLDYPRDRLEIQVLDDSTDETVEIARETVERMRAAGHDVRYLHRSDRTGFKAGALAAGLEVASGELVAIFDADFLPPADLLRRTVPHFDSPGIGMVQCRWDHLNRDDSALTRAQAVLLDGHFVIEHTARNRTGRFMSFNGTAGVWRRTAIDDAGGWSHDTLTEDLDLSYRAQLKGWDFLYLPDLTAPAELPPQMDAFKSQQHRWTKGGAQTCVKLLPSVLRSNETWRVKLEAFFHLTSCIVYILMVLLSLLIGPALLAKLIIVEPESGWRTLVDMLLFTVGTGSALAFYIVSQWQLQRRMGETVKTLPAVMALGLGIALNNALAAGEGFFSRAGEFVRTPKAGDLPEGERAAGLRRYRLGGQWKAWIELAMAAYLTVCLVSLFFFDHWVERVSLAIPFVLLFIAGYTYVALASFRTAR